MKKDKKSWYEEYLPQCPKCKSKNIEPLNLFKGHYKKYINKDIIELLGLNPNGLKNKQKYKCKDCGEESWLNEGIL